MYVTTGDEATKHISAMYALVSLRPNESLPPWLLLLLLPLAPGRP
jgi:hypothetical protein